MIQMKLEALEHPTPNTVDYNDRKQFASTILWLEDQKIRQYKIDDREGLRKVDNLPLWENAFIKYKQDLGVPSFTTEVEELSWFLSYAIRLEYLDAAEKFKTINSDGIKELKKKSHAPCIKAENFFDNMDFSHKDFIGGVRSMANKLKVSHHPNHLVQLEAVARVVHERLSPAAKNREPVCGTPFPFEIGSDVVSADDPSLDYPVRILRLLQIQSLRKLQTLINETIVSIQEIIANPKTDTKLGKVGF